MAVVVVVVVVVGSVVGLVVGDSVFDSMFVLVHRWKLSRIRHRSKRCIAMVGTDGKVRNRRMDQMNETNYTRYRM